MLKRRTTLLCALAALSLGVVLGTQGCEEEECQVDGENCSQAFKDANGIDYDCCEGLTCEEGASGVLICQ